MKIVAISDVHTKFGKLIIPECDILISAGDYSFRGQLHEVKSFHSWLNEQPSKHIISVQGNHELYVEKNFNLSKELAQHECPRVHFIDEGLVEIEGIKIWCSAITPSFHNWAWNRERGEEIKRHWDLIPNDVNILVTHGPIKGMLDEVYYIDGVTIKEHVGCQDLYNRVMQLPDLKYHICGHIHCSRGIKSFNGVTYINACICDEQYMPTNEPIVFEY